MTFSRRGWVLTSVQVGSKSSLRFEGGQVVDSDGRVVVTRPMRKLPKRPRTR